MRVDTKKVVVEKVVYIATDGKEFDDEEDCEAHEMHLAEKKLKLYRASLEPCGTIDACQYARLDTKKEVEAFIVICKYQGIDVDGVEKPGVYMYTYKSCSDTWTNISHIIKKLDESEDTISGN